MAMLHNTSVIELTRQVSVVQARVHQGRSPSCHILCLHSALQEVSPLHNAAKLAGESVCTVHVTCEARS